MAPPWLEGELLPGLPSAPPSGEGGGRSFHQRVWSRLPFECSGLHAFPVQVGGRGGGGGGYYEPLEIKQLKTIKDAVSAYGPNAPFTMALLEALAGLLLTPGDWTQLARACLSPGQYLDWKSWNEEFCVEQAAANRENNQREWNRDILLGRGAFEEDQTQYPRQVYEQISRCGLQAWRRLAGKGEHTGHLTKIIQGQGEPFSDFVARMLEAANRIFPDAEAAHPLIKQLIFEQCTKECRDVLRTNKNRSLEEWTRLCRELGGHGLTPKGRISLALFTINFLNLNHNNHSPAMEHNNPSPADKGLVRWKDVLTGQWMGPDPVVSWTRGAVCVFPQEPGCEPLWVPERLTRAVNSPPVPDKAQEDKPADTSQLDPSGTDAQRPRPSTN
ncbi:igE-binding protein-like [Cavia porcellus]|uniref:igE-binding protein-like n=1 Tax=Cavia porcellus TaxID=10141 RepID=UPI002FE07063